ncbi:hypothetical protein CH63R_03607 [Colletotrichum higginsianum IMI 349063]|uniref:Uncharacterized protein n=1 Tax=Colletotrichum higginsianum (strain IMI 349063) TaxID=759273 RepID=A0A1B7YGL9_COLHI|nr:hypothetical protein CH63R_03607 [Colletotrichum higginsianum IMI 349063]OBR11311.1 hypothetical protein CH63R_03607 [Colletotrichum higginsianum IMI 349063]
MGTTGTTLRCAVLCSPVQRWCDERRVDSGRGITGTHQTDSIAGFDGRDVGQTRPKISGSLFFFFFDCDGAGAERAVSQRNLRSPHTRRDPGQNTALYTCLVLRERPPEQRSAVRASYGASGAEQTRGNQSRGRRWRRWRRGAAVPHPGLSCLLYQT